MLWIASRLKDWSLKPIRLDANMLLKELNVPFSHRLLLAACDPLDIDRKPLEVGS